MDGFGLGWMALDKDLRSRVVRIRKILTFASLIILFYN